jgi:lysozyme family protein
MKDPFLLGLAFVLRYEGGYSNDPNDHGGATNHGVCQRVYDTYRKDHDLPTQDVRQISDAEIQDLYDKRYWKITPHPQLWEDLQCHVLQPRLAIVHFDSCVNCGPGQAALFLQRSVMVAVDGIIGPETLEAMQQFPEPVIIERYCDYRVKFYEDIVGKHPDQGRFLKGWLNRIISLKEYVTGLDFA